MDTVIVKVEADTEEFEKKLKALLEIAKEVRSVLNDINFGGPKTENHYHYHNTYPNYNGWTYGIAPCTPIGTGYSAENKLHDGHEVILTSGYSQVT